MLRFYSILHQFVSLGNFSCFSLHLFILLFFFLLPESLFNSHVILPLHFHTLPFPIFLPLHVG
uniref:Uncharacterized protein n=1 Tax=Anguilla anguilla TaxID=7936 RepID=A0A0E9WP48_ANGAN